MATIPTGDFAAQLLINGTWTTVKCLPKDGVSITGGRQKDADSADSLTCKLTLRDDGTGKLNSRNPRSPWYGLLGRGTQMRAIVPDTTHGYMPASAACASTPDTAVLDIVGDIDIRADVQPLVWDTTAGLPIADKYAVASDQRSWTLYVTPDREISFAWSPNGTLPSRLEAQSDPITVPGDGRLTLRVTLDVNNGAGGWTATFYTGTAGVAGSFAQVGAPVTGAGVTSIFASTPALRVAGTPDYPVAPDAFVGRYHGLQVRSGIGGSIVASLDFDAQALGTTSFADSAGRTWTLSGGAEIRDFDVRGAVELARFPIKNSTPNGGVISAPVTGSGIRRRIDRPKAPLRSALYREATKAEQTAYMVGYWPCEDGSDSTSLASGIGGPAMTISGDISLSSSAVFPGSQDLPTLPTGTSLSAPIPAYASTGQIAFRALVATPNPGWPNNARIAEIVQSGTSVRRWALMTDIAGNLRLQAIAADGTVLADSGPVGFGLIDTRQMLGFQVSNSGSDVYWQMFGRKINKDLSVVEGGIDGTFTGLQVGRANRVNVAADNNLTDAVIGHIMVGNSVNLASGIDTAIVGNAGELAGRRIQRLCTELGIPLRWIGNLDDTEAMGPQRADTVLNLLEACEAVDGGVLFEPRDSLTLAYRTRMSMYNQAPAVALTYGLVGESPALDPDELADADLINDYTATRRGGSSFQSVVETGALSIQDYPDGVGRADAGDTYDLAQDWQTQDIAPWKTFLGSWDESVYKRVELDWTKLSQNGKTQIAAAVARLGVADRMSIASPPIWLPPEPVELLAQGWTETIRPGKRTFSYSTTPARPWNVAVVDGNARVAADGSTIGADLSAPLTFTDNFTRTAASSWGNGWTVSAGFEPNYSVSSGLGRISMASVNISRYTLMPWAAADVVLGASVATDALAAGASILAHLVARYVDGNNSYLARVEFNTTAQVILSIRKRVGGVETQLATLTTAITHVANARVSVRFAVAGTTLLAKAWSTAGSEPAGWQLTATDASLAAAGQIGTRQILATGNTNSSPVVSWDDYSAGGALVLTSTADNGAWTTDTADMPLDVLVGAERVTLSEIVGASSPQTAIIAARALYGWGQAWPSGTAVDVADPARAAR